MFVRYLQDVKKRRASRKSQACERVTVSRDRFFVNKTNVSRNTRDQKLIIALNIEFCINRSRLFVLSDEPSRPCASRPHVYL